MRSDLFYACVFLVAGTSEACSLSVPSCDSPAVLATTQRLIAGSDHSQKKSAEWLNHAIQIAVLNEHKDDSGRHLACTASLNVPLDVIRKSKNIASFAYQLSNAGGQTPQNFTIHYTVSAPLGSVSPTVTLTPATESEAEAIQLLQMALQPNQSAENGSPSTSKPIEAPNGHAYLYVSAPNSSWDADASAANEIVYHGRRGYLATIDDEAEYQFVLRQVFGSFIPGVTYIGGRQVAPGEWKWVTGPDATFDGSKGKLFWSNRSDTQNNNPPYLRWLKTAFQPDGKWAWTQVCCATLFSYGQPALSTSLGNGDLQEGVTGYLVEFDIK